MRTGLSRTSLDEVDLGNRRELPEGGSISMRGGGTYITTKEKGPRAVAEVQAHKGKIREDQQDETGFLSFLIDIDFLVFVIKGASLKYNLYVTLD